MARDVPVDGLTRGHCQELREVARAFGLSFEAGPVAMARHPGWQVRSAGGTLALAVAGIAPAADRPALWGEAVELRRILSPMTSRPFASRPSPPRP
ncbi:hypothetical protein OJF2_38180 [Aquisphaera giovannonii]|uniref:Uncharacterized protein n=1 Tax=Aquisphaera giovannonii TaxID=406548 RepID=A0A5B9W5L7_9BACT|nr:hypothetical protein [Aquisphaera giovannonii]QEH35270.1 hypothetical protein OJF2_38180 [Aquisphaera giovannonii]